MASSMEFTIEARYALSSSRFIRSLYHGTDLTPASAYDHARVYFAARFPSLKIAPQL
jgi:hypothetical protein